MNFSWRDFCSVIEDDRKVTGKRSQLISLTNSDPWPSERKSRTSDEKPDIGKEPQKSTTHCNECGYNPLTNFFLKKALHRANTLLLNNGLYRHFGIMAVHKGLTLANLNRSCDCSNNCDHNLTTCSCNFLKYWWQTSSI